MANIEPRTMTISTLARQVRGGELRVPRFQREFVWRADQVLALLESVRLRYPIGTLFVWRTRDRYASFERVGGVPMPVDRPEPPSSVGYLLDGHQRVSCLVGVLSLTDEEAGQLKGADRVFLVYYDLVEGRFIHTRAPKPHHLPARYLLPVEPGATADPFADWMDARRDQLLPNTPERAHWDRLRRDAIALQTSFNQYQVRYDDVTDASLGEAVDIFGRVNRQGTPVRPEEVFAALSWQPDGFDFASRAGEIARDRPGFEEVRPDTFLRALLVTLGEGAHERDWTDILKHRREQLPDAMDQVEVGFELAVNHLRTRLRARSAAVVPYALQLSLLTSFYQWCPKPTEDQQRRLDKWFWVTSFASTYSGAGGSASAYQVHLTQARALASGQPVDIVSDPGTMRSLPLRFHGRSARVRAVHLFLATLDPIGLDGHPIPDVLAGGLADGRGVGTGELAQRTGARFLLGRANRIDWTRFAGKTVDERFRASHAIPAEAAAALRDGDLERFETLRFRELVRLETAFARSWGLEASSDEAPEEGEIDAD